MSVGRVRGHRASERAAGQGGWRKAAAKGCTTPGVFHGKTCIHAKSRPRRRHRCRVVEALFFFLSFSLTARLLLRNAEVPASRRVAREPSDPQRESASRRPLVRAPSSSPFLLEGFRREPPPKTHGTRLVVAGCMSQTPVSGYDAPFPLAPRGRPSRFARD